MCILLLATLKLSYVVLGLSMYNVTDTQSPISVKLALN